MHHRIDESKARQAEIQSLSTTTTQQLNDTKSALECEIATTQRTKLRQEQVHAANEEKMRDISELESRKEKLAAVNKDINRNIDL